MLKNIFQDRTDLVHIDPPLQNSPLAQLAPTSINV